MFYIVVNNNATAHQFDYLKGETLESRMEPTLVDGVPKEGQVIESKKHRVFAIDLMTKNILSVCPQDSFKKVREVLGTNRIHHLPVVKDHKLLGLITTTDLYKRHDLDDEAPVENFMDKTVLCAHEDTPLEHVLKVFINEKIHSIVVLDKQLELTGILTQNDIFKWIISEGISTN